MGVTWAEVEGCGRRGGWGLSNGQTGGCGEQAVWEVGMGASSLGGAGSPRSASHSATCSPPLCFRKC